MRGRGAAENREIRHLSECRQHGMKLARDARRRTDACVFTIAVNMSSRSRRWRQAMA
jgi:hypothetical protein